MSRGRPLAGAPRYLFVFGYGTVETEASNDRHGDDCESSQALWIDAASEEQALAWGREIAEQFVRLTSPTSPSWKQSGYANWIESAPKTRFDSKALASLPVVMAGQMPS